MVGMENVNVRRSASLLESQDKNERRRALENLRKEIQTVDVSGSEFQHVFKKILKMMSDTSEACRELSVQVVEDVIGNSTEINDLLPFLIPVLVQRIGNKNIVEGSEEVRLSLVSLFHLVISKTCSEMAQYLNESVQILRFTLVDSYPKIKQESCLCAAELAKDIPQFYMQSESLIKPLLENFTHQHSRIRVSSIQAIGDVIRYGDGKSVEVVVGSLGERLLDQVVAVRLAVTRVVGMWLLHLRDRYSHFHRLLPLLLTSTCDEMDEVRTEAIKQWDSVGKQYLKENEEELKDKIDFLTEDPKHYPPNVSRPNLGCRVLAQRNISKIVPVLARELSDWILDVRLKASQLLGVLILNAESHIMQHLEKILSMLYHASNDADAAVMRNVEKAAEYVGYFVSPRSYCKLVFPIMAEDVTSGHLKVLASILRGSDRSKLREELPELANLLQKRNVCWCRDDGYQMQLLNCCYSLMSVCQEDCRAVSQQLFTTVLSVLALSSVECIKNHAHDLLEKLQSLEDLASMSELYNQHIPLVLQELKADDVPWSIHSPQRHIFQVVLENSGEAICSYLDIVSSILVTLAKPDADAEVKVKVLTNISSLFIEKYNILEGCSGLQDFRNIIIQEMIAVNLVWRAGRTAEAVRAAAVTCLWAVLRSAPHVSSPLVDTCLPLLLSLVEDSLPKTRLMTCRALARLAQAARSNSCFTADITHKVIPVVTQRLDDVNDGVRIAAVNLITSLYRHLPDDFDTKCSSSSVDVLFSTMLLHLDDPDSHFQTIMLDALKKVAHVNPILLRDKICNSLSVSRNTEGNAELLSYVESLLQSSQC